MKEEVRRCVECGGPVSKRVIPNYRDLQIGVAVDLVGTVEEITCKKCGEKEISFPDFNGLLSAVAVARAKTPVTFNGKEIRFLRKALELTAKELAQRLEVREETISRWENDKENMSPPTERLLRVLVVKSLADQTPGVPVDEMEVLLMRVFRVREQHKRVRLVLGYRKIVHAGENQVAQDSSKGEHWRELQREAA